MRVALGIVAGTLGGPRSYGIGLAGALARRFPDDEWIVLTDRPEAFEGLPLTDCIRVAVPAKVLRPAVEATVLPGLVRKVAPDLYHGTKNGLPPRLAVPAVATLHDLAYCVLPRTFSRAARTWLAREARSAARRADRLIVPSASTARDVTRILGVPADRIDTVPNGVADAFHREVAPEAIAGVRRTHALPGRFVVSLGTLQPRKHPEVVLAAWETLRREGRAPETGLVFAGREGWMAGDFLQRLERARAEHPDVLWLPDLDDADIPPLLAAADVFVSPTAYEGFGLSIAEAMAVGTATIAGDTSSVPEVTGDAALLVPPGDAGALAAALGPLLADPVRRADLGRRGRERAARFTWDAAAVGVRAAYARALGEGGA